MGKSRESGPEGKYILDYRTGMHLKDTQVL